MSAIMWFVLEAGIALVLLLLIVWWTWPRPKRSPEKNGDSVQDPRHR